MGQILRPHSVHFGFDVPLLIGFGCEWRIGFFARIGIAAGGQGSRTPIQCRQTEVRSPTLRPD